MTLFSFTLTAACATATKTMTNAELKLEQIQELALPAPLQPGRGAFLSAASGIVIQDGTLHVVSDDENAVFSFAPGRPARVFMLAPFPLPVEPKARKAAKSDFEGLALLPAATENPYGGVLAWPSGSTPKRLRAFVLPFRADGGFAPAQEINIAALAARLSASAPDLNLEGVFFHGEDAVLVQRGNSKSGVDGLFYLPKSQFLRALAANDWSGVALRFQRLELGVFGDVRLTLSDAISTSRGILLLAAAEATESTYADGAVAGSAIYRLPAQGTPERVGLLPAGIKFEGLALEKDGAETTILLVDDADDPLKASRLFRARLKL